MGTRKMLIEKVAVDSFCFVLLSTAIGTYTIRPMDPQHAFTCGGKTVRCLMTQMISGTNRKLFISSSSWLRHMTKYAMRTNVKIYRNYLLLGQGHFGKHIFEIWLLFRTFFDHIAKFTLVIVHRGEDLKYIHSRKKLSTVSFEIRKILIEIRKLSIEIRKLQFKLILLIIIRKKTTYFRTITIEIPKCSI